MSKFECLNLQKYFNNQAATYEYEMDEGTFTLTGSSFPADEIKYGEKFIFHDVPYKLERIRSYDHLTMEDQTIRFHTYRVRKIHFLGCSNNGDFFDTVSFYKDDLEQGTGMIALSDFLSTSPKFSDKLAFSMSCMHTKKGRNLSFKPNIWCNSIEFDSLIEMNSIQFNYNPFIHIFAITLLVEES